MIEMWKPFCLKKEYKNVFLDKNININNLWILNFYNDNNNVYFIKAIHNNTFKNWLYSKLNGKTTNKKNPIYVEGEDDFLAERFEFDCNNLFLIKKNDINKIIDFNKSNGYRIKKAEEYFISEILDGISRKENEKKIINLKFLENFKKIKLENNKDFNKLYKKISNYFDFNNKRIENLEKKYNERER